MYKFCGNRVEYAICIIGLGGVDAPFAPVYIPTEQRQSMMLCCCSVSLAQHPYRVAISEEAQTRTLCIVRPALLQICFHIR